MSVPEARQGWYAVSAVTLGIFSMVTTELLPAGLLSPIAADLDVSEGTAGLMVTAPGLVAAAAAALIAGTAGRLDRRLLLAYLAAVMAVGNLACAVASHFAVILVARLAVGLSIGGFWALAAGLPVRLVPAERVGLATAAVFGGVSVASVIGVPAGTLIGDLASWRVAFAVVGVLGLASLAGLFLLLPPLPSHEPASLRRLPALIRDSNAVRLGILFTFLLVTAHFAAYTFVRPILREVSGLGGDWIGLVLLGFGAAGVVGNFLAGSAATTRVRGTLLAISAVIGFTLVTLVVVGRSPAAAVALLVVWGLAYGGVTVALQTWMRLSAPDRVEVAASLCVTAFNLSIALGALLGGLTLDLVSASAVVWLGAVFALLTALAVLAARSPLPAGQAVPAGQCVSPEPDAAAVRGVP